jgi:hypothetical protein
MFDPGLADPDDRDGEFAAAAGGLRGVEPDAFGGPPQRIAWVLGQRPCGATLAVLESLVDVPLPRKWRVLAAQAWERQRASVSALAVAAKVTATVVAPMSECTQDSADTELAFALRRTEGEIRHELSHDRRLMQFPVVFELLREGSCSPRHADALIDLTRDLIIDDAIAVDHAVGERAASMTVSGFRRVVRKAVARLDSRDPDERRQARRRQVGVRCYPAPDGLVTIAATMPATQGVAALVELNRRADAIRTPDDPRSHGERQVDALLDALGNNASTATATDMATAVATRDVAAGPPAPAPADSPPPARRSWLRSEIQVVIDWRSLLGLADNPGELLGYGPIPADDIRTMLSRPGTTLRRLVTDPVTGVLVDYGRTRYRPDAYLTGLTKARDVTCRAPGCTANASYCDGDHCVAFPDGATAAANICQLCRRHHRRKTFDGFTYSRPDPATGETVWTTPLGFTYTQQAAFYDDTGPDPGGTVPFDNDEADQRWVPSLPDPPTRSGEPPPPDATDPPF